MKINPQQAQLLEYFNLKKSDATFPLRSHVIPSELVSYLSKIMLVDIPIIEPNSIDMFTIRLSGTLLDYLFGNYTGKKIKDINEISLKSHLYTCLELVLKTGNPVIAESEANTGDVENCKVAYLAVPLSHDGMEISQIFLYIKLLS